MESGFLASHANSIRQHIPNRLIFSAAFFSRQVSYSVNLCVGHHANHGLTANWGIHIMAAIKTLWRRNKATIIYSFSLAFLLFLLRWLELRFIIFDHSYEIYIGFIAVIFTALGIWLALKLSKPKIQTVVVEKEVYVTRNGDFVPDASLAARLELSKRELEILGLLGQGDSNQEIAAKLFISLSTVKTHNQHIFEKLEVKRRIQAVEKAKRLNLIP